MFLINSFFDVKLYDINVWYFLRFHFLMKGLRDWLHSLVTMMSWFFLFLMAYDLMTHLVSWFMHCAWWSIYWFDSWKCSKVFIAFIERELVYCMWSSVKLVMMILLNGLILVDSLYFTVPLLIMLHLLAHLFWLVFINAWCLNFCW